MPQTFATLTYGNLLIKAPLPDSNNVMVSAPSASAVITVNANGQVAQFDAAKVLNITYVGSQGGSDVFSNDAGLLTLAYGYGGNNSFVGGSYANFVYFYGGDNTYNADAFSKVNDVFCNGGLGDIVNANGAPVRVYP